MNGGIFGQNFSLKVLPVWAILSIDVLVVFVSSLLAYALRYDFRSIFLDLKSATIIQYTIKGRFMSR